MELPLPVRVLKKHVCISRAVLLYTRARTLDVQNSVVYEINDINGNRREPLCRREKAERITCGRGATESLLNEKETELSLIFHGAFLSGLNLFSISLRARARAFLSIIYHRRKPLFKRSRHTTVCSALYSLVIFISVSLRTDSFKMR